MENTFYTRTLNMRELSLYTCARTHTHTHSLTLSLSHARMHTHTSTLVAGVNLSSTDFKWCGEVPAVFKTAGEVGVKFHLTFSVCAA